MLEGIVSSLASKGGAYHQSVATTGSVAGGGKDAVGARYSLIWPVIDACDRCLRKCIDTGHACDCKWGCPWGACRCPSNPADQGVVCQHCRDLGVTSAHPLYRPCLGTISDAVSARSSKVAQTRRFHCLFVVSDCESREFAWLMQLEKSADALMPRFGAPDGVHMGKSTRSGIYWWWVVKDGYMVCLRLLNVLRSSRDEAVRDALRKAVHAATLRNRDRMSFETWVELVSFSLFDALPSQDAVCTMFPELYTKLVRDCPPSSVGMIADVCAHWAGGTFFISDPGCRNYVCVAYIMYV